MLTGDEIQSGGNAFLLRKSLTDQRRSFLEQIGYCPQFDSIIDVLTGREMLMLFGRLRGLQKRDLKGQVDKWLKFVGE